MPEAVLRFWVVKAEVNVNGVTSLFCLFTKFGHLLTSLQKKQHVCWVYNFRIYYIDVKFLAVRDVTQLCIEESVLHVPTKEEWASEEPAATTHTPR